MTVYHCNDTWSTVMCWSFDNDQRHVTAFWPVCEAGHSWSYDEVKMTSPEKHFEFTWGAIEITIFL